MRNEKSSGACTNFGHYSKNILKFLLSHIGLVSLVVGYTIIGAFTFERLEAAQELKVKKNVTATRQKVTDDLWEITEDVVYFEEKIWAEKVRDRLQKFERELIKAMKNDGWDGNEDLNIQQWTFAGALFYSIILITTIGYGHIAPKTTWGKIVTIFYAIPGVPLMMLCLAGIGDGMAQSFRFLYWKVCCYACTRKPKRKRRSKSRIVRRYPSHSDQQSNISRTRASSVRQSTRASQRSQDSHTSDSAFFSNFDPEFRVNEEPVDNPGDTRQRERGDEPGRGSKKSKGNPTIDVTPSQSHKQTSDHLEIRNKDELQEDKKSSVLCNKYALQQEDIVHDGEITSVQPLKQRNNPDSPRPTSVTRITDFRSASKRNKEGDRDIEMDRKRDDKMKEPEIQVTRAPRSAPASLKGPNRAGYPDAVSPRDQKVPEYYPLPPNDPRTPRLSRLDEEYYYANYYTEEVEEEVEDDEPEDHMDKPVPIWLGVMLVVAYIFGGAFLFSGWEGWNFLDSVYFCFITLTTIGFGDFVPAQEKKENAELSIALCSLYLLFGIALLAMSFNLVQESVINHVKTIAKRLGIIKDDDEDDEDDE